MTNPQTAVTVIEPTAALQVNLDRYPEARFNRLLPMQTVGLGTDLIRPIVQVVQLTPDDSYKSPDIPEGRRALTKRALDALASTAGVDFTEERRLDDGSNPLVCGVQVRAEMLLPTGRRISTTGTRWVDMARMTWKDGLGAPQASKFKAMLYEHTSSRARNRAIRALLSLRQSYSLAELQKPFAVVSFVPNMDHPEIRSRILDAMAPAIASVYGPASARLTAGEAATEVEEAEDDEAEFREIGTGAPAAPAAASPAAVASWLDEAPAGAPAAASSFADAIRATALDEGSPKGELTGPQRATLGRIFAGFGSELVGGGLAALWGPEAAYAPPTAAQARAIELAADSDHEFKAHWQELVEAYGK